MKVTAAQIEGSRAIESRSIQNRSIESRSVVDKSKVKSGPDQVREAAELYEEQFLREMVRAMRKTVPQSDLMAPNMAEKIYREQLDDQYVEAWVRNGGTGLADLIEQQIRELQGQGRAKE